MYLSWIPMTASMFHQTLRIAGKILQTIWLFFSASVLTRSYCFPYADHNHGAEMSSTDGISIYTMHSILQNKNKWRKTSDFSNQNSIWQALCYNHFLDFFADLLLCLFLLSLLSICKKICKINFLFNCHDFHQILLLINHYFIYHILP